DYIVNGVTVTDSVYHKYTEVRVNGKLVPKQPDGSYAVLPGEGWTHVSVSALVEHGEELVAARFYTALVARTPSVELERLQIQSSSSSGVTELWMQGGSDTWT